eukprot:1160570-Pelagomonas_calceolata.AAC.2
MRGKQGHFNQKRKKRARVRRVKRLLPSSTSSYGRFCCECLLWHILWQQNEMGSRYRGSSQLLPSCMNDLGASKILQHNSSSPLLVARNEKGQQ